MTDFTVGPIEIPFGITCCGCTLPIEEKPVLHGLTIYHTDCFWAGLHIARTHGLRVIIESRA